MSYRQAGARQAYTTVRIPCDVYERIRATAEREDRTILSVIRRLASTLPPADAECEPEDAP